MLGWAASGGMALTGVPDGPPAWSPAGMWPMLVDVAERIAALSSRVGRRTVVDPAVVLGGRAGPLGLRRAGQVSASRSSRLLRCRDGWCAITLSRPADRELVPAILARELAADPWEELAAACAQRPAGEFVEHIQGFGVPAASLPADWATQTRYGALGPSRVTRIAPERRARRLDDALVVDLSSLWAGPLCSRILGEAGARVVKVESTTRPDGGRYGNSRFYDWLHAGHAAVAVDFTRADGRRMLSELIRAADVVIEASRPRALQQLGVGPDQLEQHRAGKVWVSITGYGRAAPDLVAFGDDAAVAGGLVGWHDGEPVFCADAIADPLTGVCAALAVLSAADDGGGLLLDFAMRDVAAAFAGVTVDHDQHVVRRGREGWVVSCPREGTEQRVLPPRSAEPAGTAAALGADTDRVFAELANQRR